MFCRSLVASPNSLNQARFPHMSSPTMCLVFLFPFHFVVAFFRVYLDDMGPTSGVFLGFFFLLDLSSLFPNGFLLCDHGLDL